MSSTVYAALAFAWDLGALYSLWHHATYGANRYATSPNQWLFYSGLFVACGAFLHWLGFFALRAEENR